MGNSPSTKSLSSSTQETINSADIVVFQSPYCGYCAEAVSALKNSGKEPLIINATSEQRAELEAVTKSSSVPNIWVKGTFVGGCNDGPESWMGIKKLIKNGKLDEMLSS